MLSSCTIEQRIPWPALPGIHMWLRGRTPMTKHNANRTVSRRNVLKTAGGLIAGSPVFVGRGAAETEERLRFEVDEANEEYIAVERMIRHGTVTLATLPTGGWAPPTSSRSMEIPSAFLSLASLLSLSRWNGPTRKSTGCTSARRTSTSRRWRMRRLRWDLATSPSARC